MVSKIIKQIIYITRNVFQNDCTKDFKDDCIIYSHILSTNPIVYIILVGRRLL